MKLLLDTHSFLWFIDGNPQLSVNARRLISDSTNDTFLSIASLWEIAIKISIGKLRLQQPFEVSIPQELIRNGISVLDISVDAVSVITTLPFHHKDPFDRLIIAQTQTERMPIVSTDSAFDAYEVTRLW